LLDVLFNVKEIAFDNGVKVRMIKYIEDNVLTAYIEQVKSQSVLFGGRINCGVSIVYSPLNGTGLVSVTRVLSETSLPILW